MEDMISGKEEVASVKQFDPVFDAGAHQIVSLLDVLTGNADSIDKLKLEFENRGWCIVKLPTKLQDFSITNIFHPRADYPKLLSANFDVDKLLAFFNNSLRTQCVNYSHVTHKEMIHVLTPADGTVVDIVDGFRKNRFKKIGSGDNGPGILIKDIIIGWADVLDKLSLELVAKIAQPIFGCSAEELHKKANMPVAINSHRGMLDIVKYRNFKTATLSPAVGHNTEDVNCVPHYDPGLLCISFFSNLAGLQLQDPNSKEWFAGPVNTQRGQEELGIIWLGEAAVKASYKKLKAGVHRVVYPPEPLPRLTAWYEICTTEQANNDIKQNFPYESTIKPRNIQDAKPFTFLKGLTKSQKRAAMEDFYGLPSSKPLYGGPQLDQTYDPLEYTK